MMRLVLQKSKTGFIAACLYLLAFLGLLAWIFFLASKNPADSGESGILLLPFAMPWVMWLPVEWLGLWAAFLCVLLNALIVYCLFGGLRFRNRV
jgi:uncharacterized membrane protein YhaH (DUF805 family)